jgi:hypothetical protein
VASAGKTVRKEWWLKRRLPRGDLLVHPLRRSKREKIVFVRHPRKTSFGFGVIELSCQTTCVLGSQAPVCRIVEKP